MVKLDPWQRSSPVWARRRNAAERKRPGARGRRPGHLREAEPEVLAYKEESFDEPGVLILALFKKLLGRNRRAVVENVVDEHGEPKRRLKRADLEREPYLEWNSFVDLVIMTKYEDLSPRQHGAHLALWYQSEVLNGGHLQYFENHGTAHLEETIEALRALGGEAQAAILAQARERYLAKERPRLESVREYVAEALKLECEDLDKAFFEAEPGLDDLLKKHLQENNQWYLEIVD